MGNTATSGPPISGTWEPGEVTRTGPWTVGDLWVDWASARYALLVEEAHCNALGVMHGGAMATFLDGQAFVLRDHIPGGRHIPTITLNVDFLAPPIVGEWLIAEVEHIKTTRSMIVTQALAKVGDRVMARSSVIYSNATGKDAA